MKQEIVDFIEDNNGKKPLMLVNFPLRLDIDRISLTNAPISDKLVNLIDELKSEVELTLVLLADDKTNVIVSNSEPIPRKLNLNQMRKKYYKSNEIPDEMRKLDVQLIKNSSGKNIFSELKLGAKSQLKTNNACINAYHTLLQSEIDWSKYFLISLIPQLCYYNISTYLQSETIDDLQEENNLLIQNVFYDEEGGYKIIEI